MTHQRRRLECAREMYSMRFHGEDVSTATMAQLRGREGARMKAVYRAESERTGVEWNRRNYDPNSFDTGDPINQALTSANAALYGVTHAVIVGLGFIPALGVVHTGTDRAFVYDIADLYKAEVTIPAAFDAVAENSPDINSATRRKVREAVVRERLMQRIVHDLNELMKTQPDQDPIEAELYLWSELETITAGMNWSEDVLQ